MLLQIVLTFKNVKSRQPNVNDRHGRNNVVSHLNSPRERPAGCIVRQLYTIMSAQYSTVVTVSVLCDGGKAKSVNENKCTYVKLLMSRSTFTATGPLTTYT